MKYIVAFPFVSKELGGSHISSMILMEEILAQSPNSCVMIAPAGGSLEQAAKKRNIPFRDIKPDGSENINPIDLLINSHLRVKTLLKVKRELGKNLIVHINDIYALKAWLISTRIAKAKVIYHHRSLNNMTWKKQLFLKRVDHAIPLSEVTKENLSFLPSNKVTKLINSYELDFEFDFSTARNALLTELQLPDNTIIFGYLGNFWERKRPQFFLQAAAAIVKKLPAAHFVIYGRDGDVSKSSLITATEELGISKKVSFMGFRMPPEKNVAAIDALLIPAVKEPFGRTPVEASIAGIPYLATDSAGNSEVNKIFGGGRLIAESASPEEFADASIELIQHKSDVINSKEKREDLQISVCKKVYFKKVHHIYESVSG